MSDLISRRAAIEAMQKAVKNIDSMNKADIVAVIAGMPSAQPEQRWIPCSERLPKSETDVLVTVAQGTKLVSGDILCYDTVDVMLFYNDPTERSYPFFHSGNMNDELLVGEVIAWAPLPEPYKDFSEHMNEPEEE